MDVLAIGNAIVDILAHADDSFLQEHGLTKGAMTLIDEDVAARLYDQMGPAVEVSGGGAANTAVGVASFGGAAGFVGKVRVLTPRDVNVEELSHKELAPDDALSVEPSPPGQ